METLTYKNHLISIFFEQGASNPFEEWDGYNCLMTLAARNFSKDYSKGEIVKYIANKLSDNQITYHKANLLEIINSKASGYYGQPSNIQDFNIDYPLMEYSVIERADLIREYIAEIDDLEILSDLCEYMKIPYFYGTSTGYSQGDYSDVLVAWNPSFGEITGIKENEVTTEQLESYFKLYGAWAWGDVYFYTITQSDSDEIIDSCTGFYGSDHEESGLLPTARETIDYVLQKDQKLKSDIQKYNQFVAAH